MNRAPGSDPFRPTAGSTGVVGNAGTQPSQGEADRPGGQASTGSGPATGPFSPPAIQIPRGGGAIRGLGEKFTVNAATGTGSFSIPLGASPGRSGFGPDLNLVYDSGAGNGPFGLGWGLDQPAIARRTDKGLPRYDDSDVFVLSGAEDLVPATEVVPDRDGYRITRYRPRTEGSFARIERWASRTDPTDTYWRTISAADVTTYYGRTGTERISDPADPTHVFSWLVSSSHDAFGNAIAYDYRPEDGAGVDPGLSYEQGRARSQRYLARIRYGNVHSRLDPDHAGDQDAGWLFEVVFDHGEGRLVDDPPGAAPGGPDADGHRYVRLTDGGDWVVRPDPFSSYRAGFEVRTYRRCERVLVFHTMAELGAGPTLVRDIALTYDDASGYSLLTSVRAGGHRRVGDRYRTAGLPPLDLRYSRAEFGTRARTLAAVDLPGPTRWVDLDGEGIAGALTRHDSAWWYRRNTGDGGLAAAELQATTPSTRGRLLDLAGDGSLDLVDATIAPGFHERTDEAGWSPHRPFASWPVLDWDDPAQRFTDLTGDGLPDVLRLHGDGLTWHRSLGEQGYDLPLDVRPAPELVFADGTGTVFLADLSGDGLSDLVRIRNGDIRYWPNLGYGRFGAAVVMADAPLLDAPEAFDARWIRLGDIDGSGPTDLVYLAPDGARAYANRSGNSWSAAVPITALPPLDDLAEVEVTDLLGTGTGCLVWSSPAPADAPAPVRYVELMAAGKPHLLTEAANNLGALIRITYESSTQHYLRDAREGTSWITRLPFPVHVVATVETRDLVAGNTFTTTYAYHHGHYDGVEREFRGFGRVDQRDSETFDARPVGANQDPAFHVPPVLTRSWYHTGAHLGGDRISQLYAHEYFPGDLLPDTVLPPGLTAEEEREACRALRGTLLRQEVYALDGSDREPYPYQVSEANATVRLLQPRGAGPHAVFLPHPRESLQTRLERDTADPRTTRTLTLATNEYGQVTRAVAIAFGRQAPDPALSAEARADQARAHLTCTDTTYTTPVEEADDHRLPALHTAVTYEVTGLAAALPFDQLAAAIEAAPVIAYEDDPPAAAARRPIEVERVRYLRDDLAGPADRGVVGARGLLYEAYRQAFTAGLLHRAYPQDVTALLPGAGYRDLDGDGSWWVPSGRAGYGDLATAQRHFFRPTRFDDPFGGTITVDYDGHDLVATRSTDALGNRTTAEIDYRLLAPWAVSDPNGDRTEAAYDLLGMVTATARVGNAGEGDVLDGFETDLTTAQVQAHLADPLADPAALLGRAGVRLVPDVDAFARTGAPVVVATLAREVHATDAPTSPVQQAFAYSDGFGREIQRKVQAEPDNGPRWTATGWTVFNNKGRPVQQFEPFFTATPTFAGDVRAGPSGTLFYDPPGRVVAVLNPDGSYGKTVFSPWWQREYDGNDTVATDPATDPDIGPVVQAFLTARPGRRTWLARHQGEDAATKAAAHADTPLTRVLDGLGRGFLTRADKGGALLDTRTVLDGEGNTRAVVDPLGRTVATADFDMLGTAVHRSSVDAGDRWTLNDVAGRPVAAWDGRGHAFTTTYDALRRPLTRTVAGSDPQHSDPDTLAGPVTFERIEYGEGLPDDRARHLRGRVHRRFDEAGILTHTYDFAGNTIARTREVATSVDRAIDWALAQPPGEAFTATSRYDALHRVVQTVAAHPDGAGPYDVTQPVYNEANLLERLDVWLGRAADPAGLIDPAADPPSGTTGIADIDHDAKGQRLRLELRNGVTTSYTYDPDTYRLQRLTTTRPAPFGDTVQDLAYAYDPAGNITSITDAAVAAVFFRNQVVEASNDYTYDPLYRLTRATGREHVGQGRVPYGPDDATALGLPQPGDGTAMGRYCETYDYDDAGNLVELKHLESCPGALSWTRSLVHAAGSNRLTSTTVGASTETFDHDPHGNILAMAHLPSLDWNFRDQLAASTRQAGPGGSTRYLYDADGNRVRKVRLDAGGQIVEDRIHLGDTEVYRRHSGASAGLERRTLHLVDAGRRVALVETRNGIDDGSPVQVVRYQHGNHLGSAVLELDQGAAVVSLEEYAPYGATTYQAVAADLDVPPKRYRFTGRERDEETGFSVHGVRYYAPWLARWTSADPLGVQAGANLYRYCNDSPVMLNDPSGMDPPKPRVTPLVTDIAPTGIAGDFRFHDLLSSDRSVSGHGVLGLNARAGFLLQVPQLSLNTTGLADLSGQAAVDTGLGRAGARLEGGLLLGQPSGLNLGLRGQGSFRFSVPERIGLGGLPGSLLPALTQGEGELRLGGALGYGSLSLATFRARAALAGGRFEGSLDATSIADLARLRLDATGAVSPSGEVSLDSARVRASAGIPGFRLDATAAGTGNGSGGLDVRGGARLTLFGLPSLRATATGSVSSAGVDLSARFSGAGPLYTSYITGGADYSSRAGLSGYAGVFGLTYTPGITLKDPSPPSAGTAAVLGSPANPWTPSGLTLGASYFGYRQGLVYSVSGGFIPDLSSHLFTNPRFGVTAQWHF